MSAFTQYSYLTAYELIPDTFDVINLDWDTLIQSITKQKFDDFSQKILIDSISKVWLRAWKRYTDWNKPKSS